MDQPIGEFLRRWFDAHRLDQIIEAGDLARAELAAAERHCVRLVFEGLTTS